MTTLRKIIEVGYSDEDHCWIASAPDLNGCMADGVTREDALVNLVTIVDEWFESARQMGWPIPREWR